MHTEPSHGHYEEKKPNYIPMIIIVVILAFLAWLLLHGFHGKGYMWGSETTPEHTEQGIHGAPSHEPSTPGQPNAFKDPATLGTLDSASNNFIYNIGDTEEISLPDGVKMRIGSTSSEAQLLGFLRSEEMHVDTADKTQGWIPLDRLYFESGKSSLTTASQNQLKNIAAILKAFPALEMKIGGYTDNTGSEEGNLKLSDSRAQAAMMSLVGLGAPAARLTAEGYGQEHPIADNATAEGKALNRRIDIRVTKK